MISFLVLDFNKKDESFRCLKSFKLNAKFPYKVVFCSNGGRQDYVMDFYKDGLIDELILNKENYGLGIGTKQLFGACQTEHAMYVQNDQWLIREFTEQELNRIISMLGLGDYDKAGNFHEVKSIGLAGNPCNGEYSERAHIISTRFYNSIPNKPNGGCGPRHAEPWIEGFMQDYYRQKRHIHYIYPNILFGDNGKRAIRQNPDGSVWTHFPDTKALFLESGPVKEKYVYPYFTDAEWEQVLKTQTWPAGQIPEKEKSNSFHVWN